MAHMHVVTGKDVEGVTTCALPAALETHTPGA